MDLPRITIVMPSFNQARFIEKSIRSVVDQDYPNLDFIICDGGSTDGSVDVIRAYERHLSHWVSEPDGGQTPALIKGFARSSGEIQGWLCSDDLLEPRSLHEVAAFFMADRQARVVYGDSCWIDEFDRPIRPKKEHGFSRFIWLYHENHIPQPSTFWRRSLYEEVGGLDPSFDLAMDADLWIRFADVTPLHHLPRPWSRMRFHPGQKNRRLRARSDEEDQRIRLRYLGPRPAWQLRLMKLVARGARIGRKAARGGYAHR